MENTGENALLLRKVLDSLDLRIRLWDVKKGELLFMNEKARQAYRTMELEGGAPSFRCAPPGEEFERCTECRDGEKQRWYRRSAMPLSMGGDAALLCLESEVDITEHKEALSRLEYLTRYDKLLGMPNREKLASDLKEVFKGENASGVLLLADPDAFKNINDAFGYDYGDELLQAMAGFVMSSLDLGLSSYRTGGDEAAFLLDGADGARAEEIAERLLSRFRKPWSVRGREVYCTLSIGIAAYPENGATVAELVNNADTAMCHAKKMGGNRAEWYSKSMRTYNPASRVDMECRMRRAVQQECADFLPFYQPIVDLKTKRWVGAESLVRWRLEGEDFVQPGSFIPLAEYNGLIVPIGERMLRLACMQCREWQGLSGMEDFYVSVNVSVRQLQTSNLIESVIAALAESGLPPSSLVLEVTESIAIKDMQSRVEQLRKLRQLGVRIALDDFGTGYSSLNNLRQLPLDIVKIDRSFISDIQTDEYHRSFIRFVLELAQGAKLKVCTEGIEDTAQLELVCALGGHLAQGYLFSRPIPADEFSERLREQGRW